jgi:hypothetical protein
VTHVAVPAMIHRILVALLAIAGTTLAAARAGGDPAPQADVADTPATLRAPADHTLLFEAVVAEGVQTYRCGADGTYALLGPTALLRGREGQYAVHYAGPTWHYQDGSAIVGKVMAKEPRADSIDTLLLQVTQHSGRDGFFSAVGYIQRLATTGGVAPSHCDAAHDGALAVPYSAIYRFWAPKK